MQLIHQLLLEDICTREACGVREMVDSTPVDPAQA